MPHTKPADDLPKLLHCQEKINPSSGDEVHPGWVRATAILLRGLERLQQQEQAKKEALNALPERKELVH